MRFAQAQEAEPQYITVYRGHLRKGPVRRMLANQSVQLSLRGEHFGEQPLCFVSARRVGALLLDQPRQHLLAIGTPGDELGKQRIVQRRELVAGKAVCVYPDARAAGQKERLDQASRRRKVTCWVFGGQPALDGVAMAANLLLPPGKRL